MTEDEARARIITWARNHYAENEENITPTVEVVSIQHDAQEDTWEAELDVSTSADNPHVSFFMSDIPGHGLQVTSVEY